MRAHASDVDLFLFQAVNYESNETSNWDGQLGNFQRFFSSKGYEIIHTADWAQKLYESDVQPHQDIHGPHDRCNLTARRWPIRRTPLSLRDKGPGAPEKLTSYTSTFPEKLLVSEVNLSEEPSVALDGMDIWNVGIIHGAGWGEEKLKMLETVYSRVHLQNTNTDRPLVLGGDFNAPKREDPGEITPHGANRPLYTEYPFYGDPYYLRDSSNVDSEYTFRDRWQLAERLIFDEEVSDWDMKDAYWVSGASPGRSSTEDYTHVIDVADPPHKRLDHVFVSEQFTVDRCEIWNGLDGAPNGLGSSDHAPVYAQVRLGD